MPLGGSYWMDALRDQFVQTIFAGAYAALTAAIGPLLGPMAMLALVLGALALIALPITGTSGPLNMRMILLWAVFGPLLLTLSGPYLAQFEQFRTELGAQLFSSVAGQALALGADTAHDMATPRQLYPSDACGADAAGQPALRRFSQSMQPNVDEQVAGAGVGQCQGSPLPRPAAANGVLSGWHRRPRLPIVRRHSLAQRAGAPALS